MSSRPNLTKRKSARNLTVNTCLKNEESKQSCDQNKFGCKHYKRRCQVRCPDCQEFHTCRHCHDEIKYHNEPDPKKSHQLRRHDIKEIKCLNCDHFQTPQEFCENCGIQFAGYFCKICNLYDDDYLKKEVYHCDKCGICRVGGQEKSFHCDKCNACIGIHMKDTHKCVLGTLKQDCPICMEDMHDSQQNIGVLRCGHIMHSSCLKQYLKKNIACPICKKSAIDPKSFEGHFDEELANSPMPRELKDTKMNIMCNDCLAKSQVPFHILGGKCSICCSYNTSRIEDSDTRIQYSSERETEERKRELQESPIMKYKQNFDK